MYIWVSVLWILDLNPDDIVFPPRQVTKLTGKLNTQTKVICSGLVLLIWWARTDVIEDITNRSGTRHMRNARLSLLGLGFTLAALSPEERPDHPKHEDTDT